MQVFRWIDPHFRPVIFTYFAVDIFQQSDKVNKWCSMDIWEITWQDFRMFNMYRKPTPKNSGWSNKNQAHRKKHWGECREWLGQCWFPTTFHVHTMKTNNEGLCVNSKHVPLITFDQPDRSISSSWPFHWWWFWFTPSGWWLTYTSEKWWSSSVGIITPNIWEKKHVPNHQPAIRIVVQYISEKKRMDSPSELVHESK